MDPLPLEITPEDTLKIINSGQRVRLIDVREPWEHARARIASSELIPMRNIPQHADDFGHDECRLIVYCHHGVRSLNVVQWLRQRGVPNCQSLAGGIDLWSRRIDPQTPRY